MDDILREGDQEEHDEHVSDDQEDDFETETRDGKKSGNDHSPVNRYNQDSRIHSEKLKIFLIRFLEKHGYIRSSDFDYILLPPEISILPNDNLLKATDIIRELIEVHVIIKNNDPHDNPSMIYYYLNYSIPYHNDYGTFNLSGQAVESIKILTYLVFQKHHDPMYIMSRQKFWDILSGIGFHWYSCTGDLRSTDRIVRTRLMIFYERVLERFGILEFYYNSRSGTFDVHLRQQYQRVFSEISYFAKIETDRIGKILPEIIKETNSLRELVEKIDTKPLLETVYFGVSVFYPCDFVLIVLYGLQCYYGLKSSPDSDRFDHRSLA